MENIINEGVYFVKDGKPVETLEEGVDKSRLLVIGKYFRFYLSMKDLGRATFKDAQKKAAALGDGWRCPDSFEGRTIGLASDEIKKKARMLGAMHFDKVYWFWTNERTDCLAATLVYFRNGSVHDSEVNFDSHVFALSAYARTKDNKTIDMSYAPQDMTAVEYIRNDFVEQEQPEVDLDAIVDEAFDKYSSVDGYGQLAVSFNRAELYSFIKKIARNGYDKKKKNRPDHDLQVGICGIRQASQSLCCCYGDAQEQGGAPTSISEGPNSNSILKSLTVMLRTGHTPQMSGVLPSRTLTGFFGGRIFIPHL